MGTGLSKVGFKHLGALRFSVGIYIYIYILYIYIMHRYMLFIYVLCIMPHIYLDVPRCCLLEVSCHKKIDYSWFINIS